MPISLWKARQTNPGREIILIGDAQNAHFGFLVRHVNGKKYFKRAENLEKKFVNFSTNPFDFELICLQRWMVLEAFMKENQIENCLYIDSDVLLFDEMEKDALRFQKYGMTVAGISGHTNFISGTETLTQFCDWIENAYSDPEQIKKLEYKYQQFRQIHKAGGISDMTFFTEFREANPGMVLDIGQAMEAKMFDITINYTDQLKSEKGLKKLIWQNGRPFAETLEGELIEMRSLHFQGESKREMKAMASIHSATFSILFHLNLGLILFQKAWNKLLGK